MSGSAEMAAMAEKGRVGVGRAAVIYLRLFAVQGSWNYETLLGTGIGFAVEPALRKLPGGFGSPAYCEALGRESRYFNAHPYLAGVAVGALARVELDGEDPARIERFRTALAGPLGSVGDRLVWASWLPLCSLLALIAYGLGAGPVTVMLAFLLLYNAGHLALRAWGLHLGLTQGFQVAKGLGNPVLRQGPLWIGRAASFAGGLALTVTLARIIGPSRPMTVGIAAGAMAGATLLGALRDRADGWRIALGVLAVFVLYAVVI